MPESKQMSHLNKTEYKILITLLIIYIAFAGYGGWNENSLYALTLAMGFDNQLTIDNYVNNTGLFTIDKIYYDNHWYSDKSPGLPIMGAVIVKIFKLFTNASISTTQTYSYIIIFFLVIIISGLASSLTAILIFRISMYISRDNTVALIAAFTYGIGTSAFLYGTRYRTHAIAAFLAFLCFYIVYMLRNRASITPPTILIAGFAGGWAIITELPSTVIIVSIIFLLIMIPKQAKSHNIGWFFGGLLIPLFIYGAYNLCVFGNPISISYFSTTSPPWPDTVVPIGPVAYMGIYVWKLVTQADLTYLIVLKESVLIIARNIVQSLLLTYRGLFIYSPILILSFTGITQFYRKDRQLALFLLFPFIVLLLFVAGSYDWWCHGGGSCRRFLPITPFLFLPLTLALKRIPTIIIAAFAAVSILMNLLTVNPYEGLGGYPYGVLETTVRYTIIQFFDTIASPLSGHYLPLFLQFGPQSGLIEKILCFSIIPFLNVMIVVPLIFMIWFSTVKQFIFKKRRLVAILLVVIMVMTFARIIFAEQLASYSQKKYTNYYMDKPVEPALRRAETLKVIFPVHYYEKSKDKIQFNIPYILRTNGPVVPMNEQNTHWFVPSPNFLENYTEVSMSNNATITLLLQEKHNLSYLLCLQLRSFSHDRTLEVLQENSVLLHRKISRGIQTLEVTLSLNPGENHLKFVSLEGCDLPYTKSGQLTHNLRCVSFLFRQIQFIEVNHARIDELYCRVSRSESKI
ncbi:MAG: hypothetical protein ABIF10_07105 [Candidatus Woesearchaeota archaeon]